MRRFVQADTIVPQPGNPQTLNRYAYCLNNPVARNDPSGRYGPKVHDKLTYQMLTGMYYGDTQAQEMAKALATAVAAGDMAPDQLQTEVGRRDCSTYPTNANMHFLSHQEATDLMNDTLGQEGDPPATPGEFGHALHGVQDYHRHQRPGYTIRPSVFGIEQYLSDVGEYGEEFSWMGLANSMQYGHLKTTILARLFPDHFADPDFDPDVDPGQESLWPEADAAMIAETKKHIQKWLEQYLPTYIEQYMEAQGEPTSV